MTRLAAVGLIFTLNACGGDAAEPALGAPASAERLADDGENGDVSFEFALWGDMPYARNNDAEKVSRLIQSMNERNLAFSIFNGDTKDGSSRCDDVIIVTQARERFNQLKAPAVYVLGDNEWTDCHRINNGSFDPLERLSHLRANMFSTDRSFGQTTMALLRQDGIPENSRWSYKNVVFVTLNIPGSNNNKVSEGQCLSETSGRTQADCDAANAEFATRNGLNLEWLASAFKLARDEAARGILVVIQGDPGFDLPETEDVNERDSPGYNGYTDFLTALADESQRYSGQVVLVHGDTHYFKIDKPWLVRGDPLKNFTRVETFGSPSIHWVNVRVSASNANVFDFAPVMVPGN